MTAPTYSPILSQARSWRGSRTFCHPWFAGVFAVVSMASSPSCTGAIANIARVLWRCCSYFSDLFALTSNGNCHRHCTGIVAPVLGWEFRFLILIPGTPIGSRIPTPFPIPEIPCGFFFAIPISGKSKNWNYDCKMRNCGNLFAQELTTSHRC